MFSHLTEIDGMIVRLSAVMNEDAARMVTLKCDRHIHTSTLTALLVCTTSSLARVGSTATALPDHCATIGVSVQLVQY